MFFSRALLVGLVLLESWASSRYVPLAGRSSFADDWPEVYAGIRPRDDSSGPKCRKVCGACGSSCSSQSLTKRAPLLDLVTSNATTSGYDNHLVKRTLQNVRQNQIGNYLTNKVGALVSTNQNPNTNLINLAYSTAQNDYTFATLKSFADYQSNILNIGIEGLEGCTVVAVISTKAIYMGHFFENLAFDPGTANPDQSFQQNCLNLITGQGQTWRTRGVSLDPTLFTGDNGPAVLFIMTPRQDQADPTEAEPNPPVPDANSQLYAGRIQQIVGAINGLIPGITVITYNYIATNIEDYTTGYQGKALFEWDPNADGNGNPNWRLWFEAAMESGQGIGLVPTP